MNCKTLTVSALALGILSGCANSGVSLGEPVPQQAVPADLRTCFDRLVPAPQQQTMTARELIGLVAALKRSELEKSQCGKRLLKFYDQNEGEHIDR
jgi:hypothetical protein